jgi:hypothetical protein
MEGFSFVPSVAYVVKKQPHETHKIWKGSLFCDYCSASLLRVLLVSLVEMTDSAEG